LLSTAYAAQADYVLNVRLVRFLCSIFACFVVFTHR
jgi:hypothetical protein